LTRSLANKAIRTGQVRVDGSVVKDAAFKVSVETVEYDGQELKLDKESVYIALNKPAGYICSNIDELYPSALKLLEPESYQNKVLSNSAQRAKTIPGKFKLSFAGRLDQDTTGLVLLSNDGQWVHRITSPRKTCGKVYSLSLAEAVSDQDIESLETGVMLKGESKPTKPCKIVRISANQLTIELFEGRYHQVKRMFASVGNKVTKLNRDSVGSIFLEGLTEGEWRFLTESETRSF